jgi:tetratricopeptide (TPR) repeat protein
MEGVRTGLVQLVRDFLTAHQAIRHVFAQYRAGTLRIEDVQAFVGDNDRSALFRTKERCHSLFRESSGSRTVGVRREALFDLAVGSLFHEAMKFRENFYQREVYAPRVELLRDEAGDDARALFEEFEHILDAADSRLQEALNETEALLEQTCDQFRLLLAGYRDDGLIARCLIEHRALADDVFEEGLDELFAQLHGNAVDGYVIAARSYLESASFGRARAMLQRVSEMRALDSSLRRLSTYAEGMQAFLDGRYDESLCTLNQWIDQEPDESEDAHATLALAAVSRIDRLVAPSERDEMGKQGKALAARIEPFAKRNAS